MTWLFEKITGNTSLFIGMLFSVFMLGVAGGASVQGLRLDALQAKYDGFVATVEAQGVASSTLAVAAADQDKRNKENSNHEYQTRIASLDADVKRLRNERAHSYLVPAAPTASRNSSVACFDRADLEQALRRFDDGVSNLIAEGDSNAVGLDVAKSWAAGIR